MILAKRFAYVPLLVLVAGIIAAPLTTPGRWSISLVLVWLVITVCGVAIVDRRRRAHLP